MIYFKDRYLEGDTNNDSNKKESSSGWKWPFQSRDPLAKNEDEVLDKLEFSEPPYYPSRYSKRAPQQYNAFNETMYMGESYNRTFDDYLDNQGFNYQVKPNKLEPKVYIIEPTNPSRLRINTIDKSADSNQYDILTNRLNALKRDEMPSEQYSDDQSKHWNKDESTGETICRRVLEDLYQRPFPTSRPDFLKNPETGKNLELDGYCEELGIAFEYQGEQHYKFPNVFHRNESEFISQIRRDKYKAKACELAGVYLIPVPYNIPPQEIRQYIIDRLPE